MRKKDISEICEKCADAKRCARQTLWKECPTWREWFHEKWTRIQSLFNVSERHEKKGGDDK